jgi:hypothetical protein
MNKQPLLTPPEPKKESWHPWREVEQLMKVMSQQMIYMDCIMSNELLQV